jgi:hypothetical protein
MARLVEQWVQASAWRPAVLKLVELLDSMARLVSSGSKLRLGDPLFNKDPVGVAGRVVGFDDKTGGAVAQ